MNCLVAILLAVGIVTVVQELPPIKNYHPDAEAKVKIKNQLYEEIFSLLECIEKHSHTKQEKKDYVSLKFKVMKELRKLDKELGKLDNSERALIYLKIQLEQKLSELQQKNNSK